MSWFIQWPYWFKQELHELSNNSNYRERCVFPGRTLVSCGEVLVRLKETSYFPVLIVYPEATPFDVPVVYMLSQVLDVELVKKLSELHSSAIPDQIRGFIKLHYHRHQGPTGNLCILEKDDLHDDSAAFVGARATLDRVRQWCRGLLR